MKKVYFFAAAMLLFSLMAQAKILRVGYTGIARTGTDYTDFNVAHNAAAVGDTIQIYGSVNGGTVTKRLVIMGFGYNFDVNPNLQAIGGDNPSSTSLSFYPGSDSSIVEGINASFGIGNQGTSQAGVSNVIIRRCRGNISLYNGYAPVSDIKIISCVMEYINMSHNNATVFPVTNLQVYNTFFIGINMYLATSSGSIINCVTTSPTVAGSSLNLNNANFLVKNSIIGNYRQDNINTVYENNFFGSNQPAVLPPGSNNRWGQVWENLFTRITTNDNASYLYSAEFDEDYFVLKPGSPAINGGTNASGNPTDAGIYGGEAAYRYKLSGVPAAPAIYKLTAPGTAASTNPYNITISVRSNN